MRLGKLILLGAIGGALWPTVREWCKPREAADGRPDDIATSAAVHHSDPASTLDAGTYGATRDAGPGSMRDNSGKRWDVVDESSDESFPASDPPSSY